MILIVGGAYQGKEQFAKNIFPDVKWIDGDTCALDEILSMQGILHFHAYIRRMMQEGEELSGLAEKILQDEASKQEKFAAEGKRWERIIVTDEIGYGIVPMDAFEREYREKTGRICTELAASASKVYRVICGIGTVIKE